MAGSTTASGRVQMKALAGTRRLVPLTALTKSIQSKPKTSLESTQLTNESSIWLIIKMLFPKIRQVIDKYTDYRFSTDFFRQGHVLGLLASGRSRDSPEAWSGRDSRKNNIENEGTTHDVADNKGPNFLSHDVIDNKDT
jgi:hypothetical protein